MKIIKGGVTAPKGFKAAGAHVGIKKAKKDLCLVESAVLADFAGCFTTNRVKAAPVLWDMELAEKKSKIKGIVVSSGNANACTGEQGVKDNFAMAKAFAEMAGVEVDNVLTCSTGVIGVPMPIDVITSGIKQVYPTLEGTEEASVLAAEAIMTTDTFMKTIAVEIEIDGKSVRLGGMAKGSGMIHPNMATLLSFVTTDAVISRGLLEKALKNSSEDTYNMISVDGDTSTNDTLLILANGMAENAEIQDDSEEYKTFKEALDYVNKKLAIDIVTDGEGATKLMEVKVSGAASVCDARKIAKSVTSSSLFKAALFGADANWGRVLCAMGYSEGVFNVENVDMTFRSNENDKTDEIILMKKSVPVPFDEEIAKRLLNRNKIYIDINLSDGVAQATAWGCDLTYDYVKINGDYRS